MAQVKPYMFLTVGDWKESGEVAFYDLYRYMIGTKRTSRTVEETFSGYQFIIHYNNLTDAFEVYAVTVNPDLTRVLETNESDTDQAFVDAFIDALPQNTRITNLASADFDALKALWLS